MWTKLHRPPTRGDSFLGQRSRAPRRGRTTAPGREGNPPPALGAPPPSVLGGWDDKHGAVSEMDDVVRDAPQHRARPAPAARAHNDLIGIADIGHPDDAVRRRTLDQLSFEFDTG